MGKYPKPHQHPKEVDGSAPPHLKRYNPTATFFYSGTKVLLKVEEVYDDIEGNQITVRQTRTEDGNNVIYSDWTEV